MKLNGDLFQFGDEEFTLSSGQKSSFKIECDALTDEDWYTIAVLIRDQCQFSYVVSVPRGGDRLAQALIPMTTPRSKMFVIVDDVLTTGKSMERARSHLPENVPYRGYVLFARGPCPDWVTPFFTFSAGIDLD